jgi:putative lipoprotein
MTLLLTGCSHMANDSWSGQDKAQHFLASAMLSAPAMSMRNIRVTAGIAARRLA